MGLGAESPAWSSQNYTENIFNLSMITPRTTSKQQQQLRTTKAVWFPANTVSMANNLQVFPLTSGTRKLNTVLKALSHTTTQEEYGKISKLVIKV